MARAEKRLIISPYASEAGRQGTAISINDPWASAREDYLAGRLKFTPGGQNYPNLGQQQLGQALGNLSGLGPKVIPSISDRPDIVPFPLGCPANFYQQGDVCIPVVGSYPRGSLSNPAPAGYDIAKAIIKQIPTIENVNKGQYFYVTCFVENIGAFRGKFYLRVKIPLINIDQESTGVWLPEFSNGLIYKRILMPENAPSQEMAAVAEVSHLDEQNGSKIVDDSENFTVPSPGTGGPSPTPTPTPGPDTTDCQYLGGTFYCKCDTPSEGSIIIGGQNYCPSECFTAGNNIRYCKCAANLPGSVVIGGFRYCPSPVTTPTPTPEPTPTPGASWCSSPERLEQYNRFDCGIECRNGTDMNDPLCIKCLTECFPERPCHSDHGYVWHGGQCIGHLSYGRCQQECRNSCAHLMGTGQYVPCTEACYNENCGGGNSSSEPQCFTITIPLLMHYVTHPGIAGVTVVIGSRGMQVLIAMLSSRHLPIENTTITFCPSPGNAMNDGCVKIGTTVYCPSVTGNNNGNTSAAIVLTPSTSIPDNTDLVTRGSGYSPNENITVSLKTVTHRVSTNDTKNASWEGKVFNQGETDQTDSRGEFKNTQRVMKIPSGVYGTCLVTATGKTSKKTATKSIKIV